ncbi:cysteine-rich receptor-like protein kinase 8 [Chenopodium quinoa]|nr:cysteine-rich receptor-like protein kinase 8 [Chenopodium quinoa]
MEDIRNIESLQYELSTIKLATDNFSQDNKLGKGGFGVVYKGRLVNGKEIAVKRLSEYSEQGTLEFKNEVLLVAKLQHRNLVKLLGFCLSEKEKILIYEYLPNSSLDRFLYDPLKRASLDWKTRFSIITGIARGLLYLHEDSRLKIIHRDLKSSNVLIDEAMNPKIADFGLAKLFSVDQTQGDTKRIVGTYGYMAPEYALAGQFSVKSDVYSFGVIVLEVVCGQRNNFFCRQKHEERLLHRAWRLWNENAALELVDPLLKNNFSIEEVKICIHVGLLCIQEDATKRPRMTSVVAALNGQSVTLPLPCTPHFLTANVETDEDQQIIHGHTVDVYTGSENITELCPR